MFWLFVVALWAAMLVSPVLILFFFLPAGRSCPRCGEDTLSIRSPLLRPIRRVVTRRWCMSCGWEGVTRRAAWPRRLPKLEVVPDDRDDAGDSAPWKP